MKAGSCFIKEILNKLPEDTIVENERGISVFGIPMFSPKLLMSRVDPTHWQMVDAANAIFKNIGQRSVLSRGELYPLSNSSNKEEKWFVLMDFEDTVDMDDQGWLYSWRFNSGRWKSKHGFVRRRVWVKKGNQMTSRPALSPVTPPTLSRSHSRSASELVGCHVDLLDGLLIELKRQKLDRLRFELLDELLKENQLDKSVLNDPKFVERLAMCFEFGTSKEKFLHRWLPNALNS